MQPNLPPLGRSNPLSTEPSPLSEPSASASPTDQPPVTIDVEHVSKVFNIGAEPASTLKDKLLAFRGSNSQTVEALSDVNFHVRRGESLGILGHNGSGKSTLLKIMAGTVRPSEGKVSVRGRLSALLELGAGFHPDLTGRENVFLNGSILGFSRSQVEEIFDEIVAFAELEDFVDLQVRFYSSGMTARLGFAVATNLEPDVLLVDEVLAVGDEAFQMKCMERVHRFRSLGRTMVIVSHSPEGIRQLCDRAVVLERGRMLHFGDVSEGIETYRAALHDPSGRSMATRNGSSPTTPQKLPDADELEKPVTLLSAHVVDAADEVPFMPGETVRVNVRYRLDEPVDFRIRIALRSQDNMVMMNRSTTDIDGMALPAEPGEVELQFLLADLPLLDGAYRFAIVAETPDAAHVYDRITPQEAQFKVKGPDPSFGRVNMSVHGKVRTGNQVANQRAKRAGDLLASEA